MVSMQLSRSSQHLRDTKQNTSFEASIIVPDQQLLHPTNGVCIQDNALLLKLESSFLMN